MPKRYIVLLNVLAALFALIPNAHAAITTEQEFDRFTAYYYQQPNQDDVILALQYFLSSDLFKNGMKTNGHVVEMVAYFFGRLAELQPSLLSDYHMCFDQTDKRGKLFLLSVFRVYHSQTTEVFLQQQIDRSTPEARLIIRRILDAEPLGSKAFVKPVKDFNQLDFLWMEFSVTGSKEPVERIIDVLGWEDRLRETLNRWFANHPASTERESFQRLLKDVGIEIRIVGTDIALIPPNDLDCLFSAYLQALGSRGLQPQMAKEIRQTLKLSDDDILYMATKGSALWSLQSNARQHEKVLEYCEEELESRQDKSSRELAIVVGLASNPTN